MKHRTSLLLILIVVSSLALAAQTSMTRAKTQAAPVSSLRGEQAPVKTWHELDPEIKAKVDPRLLAELRGEVIPAHLGGGVDQATIAPPKQEPLDKTRFLVYLTAKADLEAISQQRFASRVAQRTAVFNALVDTARATQGPVATALDARMSQGDVASYQPFYIFNGFAVEGDLDTIIELAQRDDVARIVANYPLVPLFGSGKEAAAPLNDLDPANWNIDLVDADRVWDEFGITGEGAVVGGFDTGVDWTHPALQPRYRGYDAAGSDHNYNWFEADTTLYPGGDLGASVSSVPYDCNGHGTHTMGTMVGDGGAPGTQVGMAPGAEWIAAPGICGNTMPGGLGDDIGGIKTFQWFLCPTDLTGTLSTADCSKAPDVVNNSWGSSNPADDTFYPVISALRAAGVAPVFASGNPSAGPGSIGSPGSAPEAITVGATDSTDTVASFSGRGPSFYEGEQKPELSAPGVNVNSTVPGGGYSTASGTSMAAPHVAGLVALMVSADLDDGFRDFDVDELERFMAYSSVDLGPTGPDDDYGYGRIDAYGAVHWARSAGDLGGTVTDAGTSAPISMATVSGKKAASGDLFTTETNASGQYSTTVPGGTYDVTVTAWGYYSDTFSGQTVITGALSVANFELTAMPTAQLTGQVLSGTTPISGAHVYVTQAPWNAYTTGSDGGYTLTMPVATHTMTVKAAGYRVLEEAVTVSPGGSSHDFGMTPAPSILLVEADASQGWFGNRPVHNFFGWALDEEGYLYDLWEIDYTTFTDTQTLPDGSLGYGVPTTTTLRAYDLIIWAHTDDSPEGMGFDDELRDYLDSGGRLILSGQDIGYYDDGEIYFDDYLHADHVARTAANEGETTSGAGFLSGLNLEITSGALHNYDNTTLALRPDAVASEDGAAYPVLTYDNGSGAAALAVDPCDANYRAVYLAVGYENVGPRAYNRDPAIADTLDRSIDWLMGTKPVYDVVVAVTPGSQIDEPGATVNYDVQVLNTGAQTDTFALSLGGNLWATHIYSGAVELTTPITIPACGGQDLSLEVDIPPTAEVGATDTVTVTATGNASDSADATTMAFPNWQVETPMPTARYRFGVTAPSDDIYYYAIGGQVVATPQSANERYNACSGQWETMAPLPVAMGNIGVAEIDGKIYVPGGYADSTYYDTLYIYDIATDSWSTGAVLSDTLWGAGVAAYDGKLYTFGGELSAGTTDRTFMYDPTTDTWSEKSPMPGGARSSMDAAELDGKIYVAGGWPSLNRVEVYDPATDTWSTAAPMNVGRQSAGLTAAPDGYLYISGGGNGWTGIGSAERYDPASDTWEMIPYLNDATRAGSGSVFVAGRVFAMGGTSGGVTGANESLKIFDAFCLSDKAVQQSTVQPGERVTYTVEIHSDLVTLTNASVVDPIPAGTTWAGFGVNAIGASYNAGQDQVEWSGTVPAGSDPLTFTFGVDVDLAGWTLGDEFANEVTFGSGAGLVFSRTVYTTLDFPSPTPSTKTVDKDEAIAGDVLTYTLYIENGGTVSDTFTMRDPIPADTTYVPGSLTYTLGTAGYDPVGDVITWTGTLPDVIYTNTSGSYEWGDSDGSGTAELVPPAAVAWEDMSGATTIWNTYQDDNVSSAYPIGFGFPWFGTTRSQFYADSNGRVQFTNGGTSWTFGSCTASIDDYIAFYAGDMEVTNVTYKQFNNRTVIEFADIGPWASSSQLEAQIILYKTGMIKLQYRNRVGSFSGGVQLRGPAGTTSAYGCPVNINNDRGIVFLPPGSSLYDFDADVTFAVTTTVPLAVNTWITNTAIITGPFDTVERSAGTLINPVELGTSTKEANKNNVALDEAVTYDFVLENSGLLTATGAVLTDPIPANTTYVPGSVACGDGSCGYAAGVITWTGDISPGGSVDLTFAVTLTTMLADMTPVTNTATLDNGYGDLYDLEATFYARAPNLSASFKQAVPDQVAPGGTVTYTVFVRNTGIVATTGEMRDELPSELTYVNGSLTCGSGSCGYASGVITWTGTVPGRSMVPVLFQASVPAGASHGDQITNTAVVTDDTWMADYDAENVVTIVEPCLPVSVDDLQSDSPVMLGETLHFSATVSGEAPITYTWDFGGAGTQGGTDTHPTFAYDAAGTYTVTLDVENACPSNDSQFIQVTVEPAPEPAWQKQIWISGDGPYGPGDSPFTGLLMTDTIQIVDRVWITYTANVTFTLEEMWSESLTLTDAISNGGDLTEGADMVTWDVSGGMTNTWYVLTKTFAVVSGTWDADYITETLTVEDAFEQPADVTLEFQHLVPCQDVSIDGLQSDSPVLLGETMYFSATVSGDTPITYDWDFGGAGTQGGTDAHPTFAYDAAGTYTVTLGVENSCPSTDTRTLSVTVNPLACVDLTAVTIAGDSSGTPGTYTFTTSYEPAGATPPIAYQWDNGDTLSTTVRNLTTVGTYTLQITATNCTTALVTDTHQIVITSGPPPTYKIYLPITFKDQ